MDDLYEDLENYNDLNTLEKLKNENRELKIKNEEFNAEIKRLQKNLLQDLEDVNAKYKILQNNYSSLFKTAKAEIERKSEIITNLNAEKDKLVLASIQNSDKSYSILKRNLANREKTNNRKGKKGDLDFRKNKKDNSDFKKNEPERVRNDENRIPTPDTVSSGHTDDSNKVSNNDNKLSKESYDKTSDSNNPKEKKALSLKQRRKSMPVLIKQATFISSDEEYEHECSDNDNKRERPPREDKSRKYFDRHKLILKVSETSGIDEKYSSCQESSRETFKINRFSDKYRIPRDKSRNRKHFSPEKVRRVTRNYPEDDRDDLRHNRVLVSPARESFDTARHFRDRRPNYDRVEGRRSRRDQSKPDRYTHREELEGRHVLDDNDDYPEKVRKPRHGYHEDRSKKRSNSDERLRQKEVYEIEKQRAAFEKRVQRDASQEDRQRHSSYEVFLTQKEDYREERLKMCKDRVETVQRDAAQEDRIRERYSSHEDDLTQKEAHRKERLEMRKEKAESFDLRDKLNERRIDDEEIQELDIKEKKKRKHRSKSRENNNKHINPNMNKFTSDCDEPSSKRSRTDSSSKVSGEAKALQQQKPTAEDRQLPAKKPIEEVKTLTDRMSIEDLLTPAGNQKEVLKPMMAPAIVEDRLLPEFAKHMLQNSCQSPDNPPLDAQPTTPISNQPREIMNTAATYLEDPRITSKKYRKGIEGDKVVITTATGRNVDLIPIDISTWDIPRVEVPQASRNPDKFTDEMVNDIYADVEDPNSNMSMLTEENESNDLRMADYLSRNFHLDYENERIKQIEARADKNVENVLHKRDSTNVQQKLDVGNKEVSVNPDDRKLPPVKYKKSRVSNDEAKQHIPPNTLGVLLQQIKTVCGVDNTAKPPATNLSVDETCSKNDDTQDRTSKSPEQKPSDSRHLRRRKMSAKELVEGDLALSDETMDNVADKQTKKEKLKEQPSSKTESQKSIAETVKDTAKPAKITTEKKTRKSRTEKVSNQKKEENCTEKQPEEKSIKKTRKKTVTTQTVTSTSEARKYIDAERKARATKSKGKFPELFGDSSSLITPEDLGIEAQTDKSNKYVPIFEDAQDAVDVNVHALMIKDLEITQPPVTSSKTDEPANTAEPKPKSIICKISLPIPTTNENVANDATQVSISKPILKTSKLENNAGLSIEIEKDNNSAANFSSAVENTTPVFIRKETPDTNKQDTNTDTTPECVKKITPNMEVSNTVETKEREVVTTVIISSGVQPEIEETQTNKLADKIETIAQTSATKITEAIPIALATSTPHKRLLQQLESELQSSSHTSSELQRDDSREDRSALSNGASIEDPNDDVPDVRIFVRRRRRVRKV
ncbi:hypothetical protein O0L34_g14331 [Tuta absoluta]|nr:hypothetical protein O0L34_g14331 [Tuta absoluta]